jgi:CheY-like chemotaxis protein
VKSVLIIEDEAAIRRVLTRVLERAGFTVRTAENGDDALQQLRAAEVDIVITDIIMPKMHGVDAIKKIVQEFSRVRIIAISGGGNFGITDYKPDAIITSAYLAAARKAGAHALLTKPFQTADVLHAIGLATSDTRPQ